MTKHKKKHASNTEKKYKQDDRGGKSKKQRPHPPTMALGARPEPDNSSAETTDRFVGILKVHPDGFGFVASEDRALEAYVNGRARAGAIDGDTVEVQWWVGPRGMDARILRILKRGRDRITAQVWGKGRRAHLKADDPRLVHPLDVIGDFAGALDGQSVLAMITQYPERPEDLLQVQVERVLGSSDDPRTEIEKILASNAIPEDFEPSVARLAEAIPKTVTEQDRRDRADLRHIPFTTIDPETARDFDDAVAIETLPRGATRLWVAVADVSHYVRENSPIDREAVQRGCSIYLPNRAIPMLPEPLSAHICSLIPKQDRCAMVARIDFNSKGDPVDSDFCAAVIHSHARMDYPGVAAALDGNLRGKNRAYKPFLPALQQMVELAGVLRTRRMKRGAMDLDLPEAKVVLDQDDPSRIRDIIRSRKDPGERGAYSMIEEFMLAANEAVARSFAEKRETTLWRIHDVPDFKKLEVFVELAVRNGIDTDVDSLSKPGGLSTLHQQLKGHAAEKPLSFQLLRSLKQATYDIVNKGHFGLAAPNYVHFTSPIRRYPDLVVHRLLKGRLAAEGKPAGGFAPHDQVPPPPPQELAEMALRSSKNERKAMEIERESVDVYRTYFMLDKVGEIYPGTVSAVTSFGIFVSLDEPFVEGLVRIEDLPGGGYQFDEKALALVAGRSGHSIGLGDRVTVEINNVSVARRKIDMRLIPAKKVPGEPSGKIPDMEDLRSRAPGRSDRRDRKPVDRGGTKRTGPGRGSTKSRPTKGRSR